MYICINILILNTFIVSLHSGQHRPKNIKKNNLLSAISIFLFLVWGHQYSFPYCSNIDDNSELYSRKKVYFFLCKVL